MKQVIMGDELNKCMQNAIDLICDAVASTLGPSGNNVIVSADLAPFITNDGVTIARNISSDDEKINSILEIIKEASLKTNEVVGDGTTTTLVLLQSIFKEGLKFIENKVNPILLKNELNKTLMVVLDEIDQIKKQATPKNVKAVSAIAVGNEEDGNFINNVFSIMKSKYSILLDESKSNKTYYEIRKGYNIEIDNISNLYFDKKDEICINNPYVLVINGYLGDLEQISKIINKVIDTNKSLLIFAEDYSDDVNNNVLSFYMQSKNIFLFKVSDYGSRKDEILKDIKSICDCNIKNINYDCVLLDDLGKCNTAVLNKNEITIINDLAGIKNRIIKLECELEKCTDDYEKEFLLNRLAKLKNGIATIYVGGNTKTEIKEKMMRFEDALCALEAAKDGVVLGEGVSFLNIKNKLDNSIGGIVMKNALSSPFNTIVKNMGFNSEDIIKLIEKSDFNKAYNFNTNKLEGINETKVIDTANSLKESITNATSIASLLLTTNYLIINSN